MCGHAIYVQGVAFVKEYRAYREELRASPDVTQHVDCSKPMCAMTSWDLQLDTASKKHTLELAIVIW